MSLLVLVPKFEKGDSIGYPGEQGRLAFGEISEVVIKKDGTVWYKLDSTNFLHEERTLMEFRTALLKQTSHLKLELHQLNCKIVGAERDIVKWKKQVIQKKLLIGNLEKELSQME